MIKAMRERVFGEVSMSVTPSAASPWDELAQPVIARLSSHWTREDDAVRGLTLPNMRIFALFSIPQVERRRRLFRRGYWLRLRQ